MTEFALVAPVLFLLLFGIIQFGLLFGAQNGVAGAVRNTARYTSTYPIANSAAALSACTAIRNQLNAELRASAPGFTGSQVTPSITFTWQANPGTPTTYRIAVRISAIYRHQLFVPLVGQIVDRFDGVVDGRWALGTVETMRIENPPLAAAEGTVTCP